MLEEIRYKIATYFIRKSEKQLRSGDFKEIKKGMRNLKIAVWIVPPSEGSSNFGKELRKIVNEHQNKIEP